MTEFHIRHIELQNPGHVMACLGALRLVTKAGIRGAHGSFVTPIEKKTEFVLSGVSGAEFVEMINSLSIANEKKLRAELGMKENIAIGGKNTLHPILLKGKWNSSDNELAFQLLLQGWLEPCSRYTGRSARKQDDMRKKSPLKFFAGKSTPETVLKPMLERLHQAKRYEPEEILLVRAGGTAQFNFNAASTWNAQRRGFSPHEESIDREVYPAIEILTAIAFDALSVARLNNKDGFSYSPWWLPLTEPDATRAFLGHLPEPWVRERYRAPIHSSGQSKFLTYAEKEDERP